MQKYQPNVFERRLLSTILTTLRPQPEGTLQKGHLMLNAEAAFFVPGPPLFEKTAKGLVRKALINIWKRYDRSIVIPVTVSKGETEEFCIFRLPWATEEYCCCCGRSRPTKPEN